MPSKSPSWIPCCVLLAWAAPLAPAAPAPHDILSAAAQTEFGGGLPVDTLAVAKSQGLDYPALVQSAGNGGVPALRRLMHFTCCDRLDAASSEGHAAVLGQLLRRVGDAKFALALAQEPPAVRKAVRDDLLYDTGLSPAGFSRWFPRAAAAISAPPPSPAPAAAQPAPALPRLPQDWKIHAQALTLDDLIARTKPTLHFNHDPCGTMFLWIGKTSSGKPFFRLATACRYQPRAAKTTWIIPQCEDLLFQDKDTQPLPLTTISLHQTPPSDFNMATQNWARTLAADPVHGTLYEIEFFFNSSGEATRGHRLILLQTPAGPWRLVTRLDGSYWDESGWEEQTTVRPRWTGDPQSPLELTVSWRGSISNVSDQIPPQDRGPFWGSTRVYTGSLPFVEPTSERCFITVQKGQTFNTLLRRIVANDFDEAAPGIRKNATASLRAAILHLNPTLHPDQLRIGQEITIPNPQTRQAILR